MTFACTLVLGAATVSGTVDISGSSKSSTELVLWLEPLDGKVEMPRSLPHRTLLQKDKTFRPHVLPILVGTVVDFPNADPIFHNAFSNYEGQIFDVSLYPPGTSRAIRFRRPGVVRVFCNIHPMMSAVILVLDTPYFTQPAADGHYRLTDIPVGSYDLHVFDERATKDPVMTPRLDVTSPNETLAAAPIHVSEAGYVATPHHNKYGREYPPDSGNGSYSTIPQ